jgi:hypothetical protein
LARRSVCSLSSVSCCRRLVCSVDQLLRGDTHEGDRIAHGAGRDAVARACAAVRSRGGAGDARPRTGWLVARMRSGKCCRIARADERDRRTGPCRCRSRAVRCGGRDRPRASAPCDARRPAGRPRSNQ